jgi:hypothetical protein
MYAQRSRLVIRVLSPLSGRNKLPLFKAANIETIIRLFKLIRGALGQQKYPSKIQTESGIRDTCCYHLQSGDEHLGQQQDE